MSDEEGYNSSDDDDYVPTDGEAVSEEENSGDEENLDALKDDSEPLKTGKRKRKTQKAQPGPRGKRTGGIKLDEAGAQVDPTEHDAGNKELEQMIKLEQEQKKEEQEKKKANDLWSSFMSDVGKRPPKKPVAASSSLGSLGSLTKPITPTQSSPASSVESSISKPTSATSATSTITVTKVYDFAGEAVQVTKELDINSKEGKAELKRQQKEEETKDEDKPKEKPSTSAMIGVKKPSGGLGGVLAKINQKPKMGTLDKSKLDWEMFKKKEGIEEELKIHNRGKESYIERMNFLQRADVRQFEIEKNLRLSSSSKR